MPCGIRHRRGTRTLGSALLAALVVAEVGSGVARADDRISPTPVILVSVDTLRADHLSCYDYHRFPTPHIDSLRDEGTLFTQTDSVIPLTLPSHTCLLTSTYPFVNGVEENEDKLGPAQPTLAALLQSNGYRTAAFIGGYFLARRFGLGRGFGVYDAPFPDSSASLARPLDLKRPAARVAGEAMQWLKENSRARFFVFMHFFDMHEPYNPPASLKPHYGSDQYDAELGYVDEVLGRFWRFLEKEHLYDRSLIILTADHGESLGEHGESTHGYFIYQSTVHVPLIVKWPKGTGPYTREVTAPVSLIDVAPTILQVLGMTAPPTFQGQSLLDLVGPGAPAVQREVYSESLYARDRLGCAPLRSLRLGSTQYIEAPKPELYDVDHDPEEVHNLAPEEQALAASFKNKLEALRSRYGARARPAAQASASREVAAKLRSLGYLATSVPRQAFSDSGPDPKDRLAEYRQYQRGIRLLAAGPLWEAEATFKEILNEDARNLTGRYDLALCYLEDGRSYDAAVQLKNALAVEPHDVQATELLGSIWAGARQYERARAEFKYLLSFAPQDYTAEFGLGFVAEREERLDDAVRHFQAAVRLRPGAVKAHRALGEIYLQRRAFGPAESELAEVTRLRPHSARAHYELGLALENQGLTSNAAQAFREALHYNPKLVAARTALESLRPAP
ncbi:MAG TPA: sulfatase-like hydrolase/transferase [Terriglobia bacterium]|nr:sulfatase-like hydrolase/transferase [Terriglobia bacterium]